MISSGTQTIGTAAVQIDGNSVHWTRLHIRNNDTTKTLYLGNHDLTIANGLPVDKLVTIEIDIPPGESIYMLTESGSHSISWLRIEHD